MSTNRSHPDDEESILLRASGGDLGAFNQLVRYYQEMAYNHACALLGDPDLAEDVTQESFIKAFQAMRTFRGGSFRGWLLRIVTNSAYDLLRHAGRHPTRSLFPMDEHGEEMESPSWMADRALSVQAAVEQNEVTRHVYRLLDELPAAYRSVLTLIDVQELDYTEAAEALDIPLGTVKSRLARARLQMRQKLADTLQIHGPVTGSRAGLAA